MVEVEIDCSFDDCDVKPDKMTEMVAWLAYFKRLHPRSVKDNYFEEEIDAVASGIFHFPSKGKREDGLQLEPDEGAYIEDLMVEINFGEKKLDITEYMEDSFLQQCGEKIEEKVIQR